MSTTYFVTKLLSPLTKVELSGMIMKQLGK